MTVSVPSLKMPPPVPYRAVAREGAVGDGQRAVVKDAAAVDAELPLAIVRSFKLSVAPEFTTAPGKVGAVDGDGLPGAVDGQTCRAKCSRLREACCPA